MNLYQILAGGPGSGCHGPHCGRPVVGAKRLKSMRRVLRQQGFKMRRILTPHQVQDTYNAWKKGAAQRKQNAFVQKKAGKAVKQGVKNIPKVPKGLPAGLHQKNGVQFINVQPVRKGQVKVKQGNIIILKPKGQYEKTNKTWLKKVSPFKGQFQRVFAMDQFGDPNTKNSFWVYRDAAKGQAIQVSRDFGKKSVAVKEIDTKDFDFITRTRIARFNNIGNASGFLAKRYGITFRLGGKA